MYKSTKKLHDYIESFLNGNIDGRTFEKEFTNCYDFEDLEAGQDLKYFQNIRTLLERFSPYESDLKEHPEYYINEGQLRANIGSLSAQ